MTSTCAVFLLLVLALVPHRCDALADRWGACGATVSSGKWGVCMDADLKNVNSECCAAIEAVQSGTPPSFEEFCSACKNQGKGYVHEEIILICAPNQTQRTVVDAFLLDVETAGNVQGTFAMKDGPCEAQSTDCTSKLGFGAQAFLGGSGEILWRSVPHSCCAPLNTYLKDIWAPGAVDLMCNECNVTKNAAIQMLYMEGFPCYVPPHVV